MCLAMPVEVIALLPGQKARVRVDGVTQEVSLELVGETAVGEFVLLHVGYAIAKLDRRQADEALAALAALAALDDGAPLTPLAPLAETGGQGPTSLS